MPPRSLLFMAPVRPGVDAALARLLQSVGDDVRGRRLSENPGAFHIHFARSRTIHFARFALLPDPDRGENQYRLLYASIFDGNLSDHLRELIDLVTDPDQLWAYCEGYPGMDRFEEFARAHLLEPDAYYVAFRDGTVEGVHRHLALRHEIDALLDADPVGGMAKVEGWLAKELQRSRGLARRFRDLSRRVQTWAACIFRALPLGWDVGRALLRFGPLMVWRSTSEILASLDRYPAVRLFNRWTRNRMPAMGSHHSSLALDRCVWIRPPAPTEGSLPGDLPPSYREDAVAQNQLTLLTRVVPEQRLRLGAVLSAIDSMSKRLTPPGSLTGIRTIHFVRWTVVDEGRRLLMVSDYDGTWENYIDEFAEMILSGLDAIWGGAPGSPPDGARDLPAFKDFLRTHQVPAHVFYSAYPGTTTEHILANRLLARALGSRTGQGAP